MYNSETANGTIRIRTKEKRKKKKTKDNFYKKKKKGGRARKGKEERRGPSGVKILNEVQESHSSGTWYHLLFLADVATTMLVPRFA